jgi:hypothetical protein
LKRKPAPVDQGPDFPWPLEYLWNDFNEISLGLASNGFGAALITWESLQAWQRLRGLEIDPNDASTLIRLSHRRAVILEEKQPGASQDKDRPDRKGRQHHRK